jgi:hypothetical protein
MGLTELNAGFGISGWCDGIATEDYADVSRDKLGCASLCHSHQTEQRDGCDERSVAAHDRGLDESASMAVLKHGMRLR